MKKPKIYQPYNRYLVKTNPDLDVYDLRGFKHFLEKEKLKNESKK